MILNADLFADLYQKVTGQEVSPNGTGVSDDVRNALNDLRLLDNSSPLYFLDLAEALAGLFDNYMPFVPLCFDQDTVYLRGSFVSNVSVTSHDIFYNIDSWALPK